VALGSVEAVTSRIAKLVRMYSSVRANAFSSSLFFGTNASQAMDSVAGLMEPG